MMRKSSVLAASAALLSLGALTGPAIAAGDHHTGHAIRACTNSDLRASYTAEDAATSHRFGRIALKNVSGSACATGGYGGLSYVGHGNGTQIGAAATRDDSVRVRTIVLKPGQSVVSQVSEAVASVYPRNKCQPRHVDGFRVYVPNSTTSQYIKHPTTGCQNTDVHLISHRAYVR